MNRLCVLFATALLAVGTTGALAQPFNKSPFPLKAERVADLGDWTPEDVTVRGSTQGFSISGRYGFVFHDKGQCAVYDLKKKACVNTFHMGVEESCHCNNASFGREKFSKQSPFPLLYLSECRGRHAAFVYDITTEGATLVQTILLDSNPFGSSFDWCVDPDEGFLYAYGGTRNGSKFLWKFPLPTLADSDAHGEVHLTEADALDVIEIPGLFIFQGSKIYHGYAFLTQGFPPYRLSLFVVNLRSHETEAIIDLDPLKVEPEGLDVQGKWLYTAHHTSKKARNTILWRHSLK